MRSGTIIGLVGWIALSVSTVGGSALAQAPEPAQDAFLDSLVGSWSGSGEVAGHPISHTYTWSWSLGHQFLFGEHRGTITVDGQDQTAEVHFYLHPNGDGTYTGVSVSSEGVIREMAASLSPEGAFVTDDTREDGTTSRLTASVSGDELTITVLMGDAAGTWTEVGTSTLTRP